MKTQKTDFSHIKTGIELQDFLRLELQEKYQGLYFHIDYDEIPNRRLVIVFYNALSSVDMYTISLSGNISVIIDGFDENNKITQNMSTRCLKSKEIELLMNFSTQNGNISKIITYILKKFKSLNLEKVTCSTKHLEKIQEYKEINTLEEEPKEIINITESEIKKVEPKKVDVNRSKKVF